MSFPRWPRPPSSVSRTPCWARTCARWYACAPGRPSSSSTPCGPPSPTDWPTTSCRDGWSGGTGRRSWSSTAKASSRRGATISTARSPRTRSGPPSIARSEHWQGGVVSDAFEADLHRHADADVGGFASDDVRHEPGPLLEVDDGHDVGNEVAEGAREVLADDGVAVHGPPAAGLHPLDRSPA